MELHECRTEGLRAMWRIRSAIRHFWSAKLHLVMLQCLRNGGPTPNAFPIHIPRFHDFWKNLLRLWLWNILLVSYKLFETYFKPD